MTELKALLVAALVWLGVAALAIGGATSGTISIPFPGPGGADCANPGNDSNALWLVQGQSAGFPDTSIGNGSSPHTTTTTGTVTLTTSSPSPPTALFTGSMKFGTTTNDWVGTSTGAANFQTAANANLTLDLWINFNTNQQSSIYSDLANSETIIDWEYVPGTGVRIQNNSGGTHGFAFTPTLGQWYFLAIVRSGGATGTWNVYIDGTALSGSFVDAAAINPTGGVQVGQRATGATQLKGNMAGVRWSNIARWTTNFTRPTGPWC